MGYEKFLKQKKETKYLSGKYIYYFCDLPRKTGQIFNLLINSRILCYSEKKLCWHSLVKETFFWSSFLTIKHKNYSLCSVLALESFSSLRPFRIQLPNAFTSHGRQCSVLPASCLALILLNNRVLSLKFVSPVIFCSNTLLLSQLY